MVVTVPAPNDPVIKMRPSFSSSFYFRVLPSQMASLSFSDNLWIRGRFGTSPPWLDQSPGCGFAETKKAGPGHMQAVSDPTTCREPPEKSIQNVVSRTSSQSDSQDIANNHGLTTSISQSVSDAFPQLSTERTVQEIQSPTPPESRMVMVSPSIATMQDSVLSIRFPFLVKK